MHYIKRKIEVRAICAMTADETIGVDNGLPWKMGEQKLDMKRFRTLTTEGGVVIMGRKTWESMGSRSLPKRYNIIVTSQVSYQGDDNSILAHSMEQALQIAEGFQETTAERLTAYVIGGAEIYRQAVEMGVVSVFHVSYIAKYLQVSYPSVCVKFPCRFPISDWEQRNESFFDSGEGDVSAGRFVDYVSRAWMVSEDVPDGNEADAAFSSRPEPKDNGWIRMADGKPTEYGKYEVYRAGCKKQHYQTWNNTGWAYDNADITHWRHIVPPTTEA